MSNNLLQSADLGEYFLTKEGLDSLVLSLKMAKQIVLKDSEKIPADSQLASLPYDHVQLLKQLWGLALGRQADFTWNNFLAQLESLLFESLAHMVTLRVAYQPTLEQLSELTSAVRLQYSPSAVLDLVYEPRLIGGCIMEVNGERLDCSLKTKLEKASQQIAN